MLWCPSRWCLPLTPQGEGYIYLNLLSSDQSPSPRALIPDAHWMQYNPVLPTVWLGSFPPACVLPATDHISPWPMRGDGVCALPLRYPFSLMKKWEEDLFMDGIWPSSTVPLLASGAPSGCLCWPVLAGFRCSFMIPMSWVTAVPLFIHCTNFNLNEWPLVTPPSFSVIPKRY